MAWCLVKHRDIFTFINEYTREISVFLTHGSVKEDIVDVGTRNPWVNFRDESCLR
jgi:hypothetical protein